MIYFAQPTNGGPIRIGASGQMKSRRRALGTWLPGGIEVVHEIDGGLLGEAVLHRAFEPLRVERDWFRSAPVLWRFILGAMQGRPEWVPSQSDGAPIFNHEEIIAEHGGVEQAAQRCGYNSAAAFHEAGKHQTGNGYSYASRVIFDRLLRGGAIPGYIAALHPVIARPTHTHNTRSAPVPPGAADRPSAMRSSSRASVLGLPNSTHGAGA